MKNWLTIAFVAAIWLVGCSSPSQPEARLLGKWQSDAGSSKIDRHPARNGYQFEFLADGTVVRNEELNGKWSQVAAGTFTFIDRTHLKIDLAPSWFYGTTVHEVTWLDGDHIDLRAGDNIQRLIRVK